MASDLKAAFPGMTGLSPRNLKYMRSFAAAYADESIVQGVLAQITWYHNIALPIENGWIRNVFVLQIENKLFDRQGKSLTNFKGNLPNPDLDLAQNLLKSEYNYSKKWILHSLHCKTTMKQNLKKLDDAVSMM